MSTVDAAGLNGDLPLSREETAAYLGHHAERNRGLAAASREAGVRTRPAPVWGTALHGGSSPARAMLDAFFEWFASRTANRFAGRPVTIVDLGCGGGVGIKPLAQSGFAGEYIGLDAARSARWSDARIGGLQPRLMLADVHEFDERLLPPIDVLISATALEHFRDDAEVIRRFSCRLARGGVQAHFVPGEAALDLYGKHGWRQYSPVCLRRLFPDATIYRFGGVFSNAIHRWAITDPSSRGRPLLGQRHPTAYAWLRAGSLALDRATGCRAPSMYGVVTKPTCGDGASIAAASRAA